MSAFFAEAYPLTDRYYFGERYPSKFLLLVPFGDWMPMLSSSVIFIDLNRGKFGELPERKY